MRDRAAVMSCNISYQQRSLSTFHIFCFLKVSKCLKTMYPVRENRVLSFVKSAMLRRRNTFQSLSSDLFLLFSGGIHDGERAVSAVDSSCTERVHKRKEVSVIYIARWNTRVLDLISVNKRITVALLNNV